MFVHIQSSDVVRLIQQFLKEQNLFKTLHSLKEESGVDFNDIKEPQKLIKDIKSGKWNSVLDSIETIRLPKSKSMALYEQIILELGDIGDIETALSLLKRSSTLSLLRKDFGPRVTALQKTLTSYPFNTTEYYSSESQKQDRRSKIADEIAEEIYSVAPSRLLSLLDQSLKWQQYTGTLPKGSKIDLLRNIRDNEKSGKDEIISRLDCVIKFGHDNTYAESAAFSPDGQLLATGTVDGFIELWDFETGKLRLDIKYQAQDEFMIHDAPVMSLAFSRDSERIAIGGKDGNIKVFTLVDGECVVYMKDVHGGSVTALDFSPQGDRIVSASLDNTAKVHGLNSQKTLFVLAGHKSYVNMAKFHQNDAIVTTSADGTMKMWDSKNGNCVKTIHPYAMTDSELSIVSAVQFPHEEMYFVAFRSNFINLVKADGSIVKRFSYSDAKNTEISFVSIAVSSKGKLLYAMDENQILYCFSVSSGKLLKAIKSHEKNVYGITHHPHLNILATFSMDCSLRLWRSENK